MKRAGLPQRRLTRHLIAKPRKNGSYAYYWQPPTRLRKLADKPAWLKATPLKDRDGRFLSLEAAMKAAEALNARLDNWRKGQEENSGEMTALLRRWQSSADYLAMREKTRKDYDKHIAVLVADLGFATEGEWTPGAIERYKDHLLTKRGTGERQVGYRLAVIRQFWNWARRQGHVTADNPASKPKIKTRRLDDEQMEEQVWSKGQLLEACSLPYPMPLVTRLALYTAQRQGDILKMKWSDIKDGSLRLRQGKTGKVLRLPLCRRVRAVLRHAPKRGETIVATRDGRPYTSDGFRSIWQRYAKGRGWPKFHSIRRTVSTWLRQGGLTGDDVMLWTGHARQGEQAILDIYIVKAPEMARKAHPIMQRWRV